MFNVIGRVAGNSSQLRHLVKCTSFIQSLRTYASFTLRDIIEEVSDETGTLSLQFAKHVALERQKDAPIVPTTIRYADFFPVTDLRYFQRELNRVPAEQLAALIIYAFTYRSNADPSKFATVLNYIDAKALSLLSDMNDDTVLSTLYALLFLMPNWITRTDFYHAAVRRLSEEDFTKTSASKEKFVQLCFYLGLDKNRDQSKTKLLRGVLNKHLDRVLPELNTMDLAVVCNTAFRTSTQVQNDAYNARLEQETLALPLDGAHDALLVTFLKSMRLQRVRSDSVCKHLEKLCNNIDTLRQLQSRGLAHVAAFFAENLWDAESCVKPLMSEFCIRLRQNNKAFSHAEMLRPKDLATFLWSSAQLNCKFSADELQLMESVALRKVQNKEFRFYADQLVDCCLSLWTLGCRSRNLLQESINSKSQQTRSNQKQPKVDSRVTVLLSAAAIEEPNWKLPFVKPAEAFDIDTPVPAHLLKDLSDLSDYAKKVSKEEGVLEVKVVCPIKGINIPGLLVHFDAAKVFVELLKDEQLLRFSGEPVSIVRLKRRLLNVLGHKVVLVRARDLQEKYTNLENLSFGNETDEPKELEEDKRQKEKTARSI